MQDPEEEHEFLEQLLRSRELNCLVKAHNVILFCNQEQARGGNSIGTVLYLGREVLTVHKGLRQGLIIMIRPHCHHTASV